MLQRRFPPGKDLDEIAVWATKQPGWDQMFDALAEQAAEHFGEPFSWFRWIHRLPPRPEIPSGVVSPERERAWREGRRREERVLPPEIEQKFRELVVRAVLELPASVAGPGPGSEIETGEGALEADESATPPTSRYRPPDQLPLETVRECETLLEKRAAATHRGRAPSELTHEQIGLTVGLNRQRVRQIEELMAVGWDLSRSHPDFSADEGHVRLPTVKAASALLSR